MTCKTGSDNRQGEEWQHGLLGENEWIDDKRARRKGRKEEGEDWF